MITHLDLAAAIVVARTPFPYAELCRTLQTCDLAVLPVNTNDEAIEQAHSVVARLVVLTLPVPDVTGLAPCAQIRALPHYARVPIILIALDPGIQALHAASEAGATRVLLPPFSLGGLQQAILPLFGATPPPTAPVMEWPRQAEPQPLFGEPKAFVDGRHLINFYHRGRPSPQSRRTNWTR